MRKKKQIHRIAKALEDKLPKIMELYRRCLPNYTPAHNRFHCNMELQLYRIAENLKKHANGEVCDAGEWFFDTYDLVNALTLLEVIAKDKETHSLLINACKALSSGYDQVTGRCFTQSNSRI